MHVLIIGNGISGITTARHLRKKDPHVRITVVSSETRYFFSRTALMYIYMGHMTYAHTKPYEDAFWKKNRIDLCYAHVEKIDAANNQVILQDGTALAYDKLVLALGSRSRGLGAQVDQKGVQGLYSYADLQQMERSTAKIRHAVVVGGGLIGVEMVEMLRSRGIQTTFLVRESSYWNNVLPKEESELINQHLRCHQIDLRLNTQLTRIEGTDHVQAVHTDQGEVIPCQFVGVAIGVEPNTACVNADEIDVDKGVLVNDVLQSSHPDIYAVGDCAQLRTPPKHRRAIEPVWYAGRMMGEALAHTLLGMPTPYDPGMWFNSAKFFDIEYQTYGYVPAATAGSKNTQSLYWAHPNGRLAMRIVVDASKAVCGCNVLGIRQRHAVWKRWIEQAAPLSEVLQHLEEARFDESFAHTYEPRLREKYPDSRIIPSSVTM